MHLLHFLLNINHLFKRYREDTPGVLSGGMRKRTKNVPPKVEHWKCETPITESAYKILKSKSGTFRHKVEHFEKIENVDIKAIIGIIPTQIYLYRYGCSTVPPDS